MYNMTNSDMQKVLRYATLTFRAERNEVTSDESREKEEILSELRTRYGLSHRGIIELAERNVTESL